MGSAAANKKAPRAFNSRREYKGPRISKDFSTKLRGELLAGRGADVIVVLERPDVASNKLANARKTQRNTLLSRAGTGVELKQSFDSLGYALLRVKSIQALDNLLAQAEIKRFVANNTFSPLSTTTSANFIRRDTAASTIAFDPDNSCGAANNGTACTTNLCVGGAKAGQACTVLADCDAPACSAVHYADDLGSYDSNAGAGVTVATIGIALLDGNADEENSAVGAATVATTKDFVGLTDAAEPTASKNHATVMAAIIHKVAPAAKIHNVDITNASGVATTATILAGLEWVHDDLVGDVSAVSLSYGDNGLYASAQDCEAGAGLQDAVDILRDEGIVTFVASGNSGSSTSLSSPACLPNVVSVGAVQGKSAASPTVTLTRTTFNGTTTTTTTCSQSSTDPDRMLCNSNSNGELDLLAPGLTIDIDTEVNDNVCNTGVSEGKVCTSSATCTANLLCHTVSGKCANVASGTPTYTSSTSCTTDANCQVDGVCTDVDGLCVGGTTVGKACGDATDCSGAGATCNVSLPPQSGSSAATAHVAGAFAVVLADNRHSDQGVERALGRLKGGAVTVPWSGNSLEFPRIDLPGAIEDCVGPLLTETVGATCLKTCVGGENAGDTCTADAQCQVPTYNCTSGTCAGGPNNTGNCTGDADCNIGADGVCGTQVGSCTGGSNNGTQCTSSLQCTGGGTCGSMAAHGTCEGGTLDGEYCADDTECEGEDDGDNVTVAAAGGDVTVSVETELGCSADGICVNGSTPGLACGVDADCVSHGACKAYCIDGDNDGTECTTNGDCTGGGTCDLAGASCAGGWKDGDSCSIASSPDTCLAATGGTCTGLQSSDSSWLTATFSGSDVTVSADPNAAGDARSGSITAFGKAITVFQEGASSAPTNVSVTIVEGYGARCTAGPANGNACQSTTPAPTDCPGTLDSCTSGDWWVPTADLKPDFIIAATGATEYCIINDNADTEEGCPGTWVEPSSFPVTIDEWATAAGAGSKRVKVWVRDAYGHETRADDLVFKMDSAVPPVHTVSYTVGSNAITLSLGASANDPVSGVNRLKISRNENASGAATAPASCDTGADVTTIAYTHGSSVSDPFGDVTNGTTYQYCVCRIDASGQKGASVCTSTALGPKDDIVAPTGTLAFDATAYKTTAATVHIVSSGDTRFSNLSQGTCTGGSNAGTSCLAGGAECLGGGSCTTTGTKAIPDLCLSLANDLTTDDTCTTLGGWKTGLTAAGTTLPSGTPIDVTLANTTNGTHTLYYKWMDDAAPTKNVSSVQQITTTFDDVVTRRGHGDRGRAERLRRQGDVVRRDRHGWQRRGLVRPSLLHHDHRAG